MLVAEIHGKRVLEAQNSEDYLTSAVFGHLRYVPPGLFWARLFQKALSLPIDGRERSLAEIAEAARRDIAAYDQLEIYFWPSHPQGQPEMAMSFTGTRQEPLVVLVEAKLHAPKSGLRERDQLMRYLRIAGDLGGLRPTVPVGTLALVVYLTPKEALEELKESLREAGDTPANSAKLFRLQWQDIVWAVGESVQGERGVAQLILTDVRRFLRRRQLEYFKGFEKVKDLENLSRGSGAFYRQESLFGGFRAVEGLASVRVVRGGWCNGN